MATCHFCGLRNADTNIDCWKCGAPLPAMDGLEDDDDIDFLAAPRDKAASEPAQAHPSRSPIGDSAPPVIGAKQCPKCGKDYGMRFSPPMACPDCRVILGPPMTRGEMYRNGGFALAAIIGVPALIILGLVWLLSPGSCPECYVRLEWTSGDAIRFQGTGPEYNMGPTGQSGTVVLHEGRDTINCSWRPRGDYALRGAVVMLDGPTVGTPFFFYPEGGDPQSREFYDLEPGEYEVSVRHGSGVKFSLVCYAAAADDTPTPTA